MVILIQIFNQENLKTMIMVDMEVELEENLEEKEKLKKMSKM